MQNSNSNNLIIKDYFFCFFQKLVGFLPTSVKNLFNS